MLFNVNAVSDWSKNVYSIKIANVLMVKQSLKNHLKSLPLPPQKTLSLIGRGVKKST